MRERKKLSSGRVLGESQIFCSLQKFVHRGCLSSYLHVTAPTFVELPGSGCSDCSGHLQLEGPHHAGVAREKSTRPRAEQDRLQAT